MAFSAMPQSGELRLVNKLDGYVFKSMPVISPDGRLVFVEVESEDDEGQRFFLFVDLSTGKLRCQIKKRKYGDYESLHFDTPLTVSFTDFKQTYRADSQSCTLTKAPSPSAILADDYNYPRFGSSAQTAALRWNKGSVRKKEKEMELEESVAALIAPDGSEITFRGHEKGLRDAALSPDGHRVVTSSVDGTLRIWDAKSGKPLHQIDFKDGAPAYLRFSPDGQTVLAYTSTILVNNRLTYMIDVNSGNILRKFDTKSKASKSARKSFNLSGKNSGAGHFDVWFSPDGSRIYAQRGLKEIQVFDRKSGKEKNVLDAVRWVGKRNDCSDCAYFPALSENAVHIYNAATMAREISTDGKYLQDHYDQCGYYSDGRNALIMTDDGRVIIHQVGIAMFIWQWDR